MKTDFLRHIRRQPFATSTVLKDAWLPNRRLSNQTVRNRLKTAGLRSRRVIKRPQLTVRHKRERSRWCRERRGWNLRSWRRVHWSDESRFLLHKVDGRIRVWRAPNTRYSPRNIVPTVPHGGGSIMVWGCFSYDCKLDLVTVQGTLTGARYIQEVLDPVVIDNHRLATTPIFMDDNARPHRARAVMQHLENNGISHIPWPAMSPDLNPIEHVWDQIDRQVRRRTPSPQNLRQLEAAIHEEWRRLPNARLRRLVLGMPRRVLAVHRARGGSTRY